MHTVTDKYLFCVLQVFTNAEKRAQFAQLHGLSQRDFNASYACYKKSLILLVPQCH